MRLSTLGKLGGKVMVTFWELLKESVIVQSIVTLALTLTVCVMSYQGNPIPDWFLASYATVLGFWFGTKAQASAIKAACKDKV